MPRLNLNEYVRELQEGEVPLLGFTLFFNLTSKIEHEAYIQAHELSGLADDLKLKEIRPWMAARRTVQRWTSEMKKADSIGKAEIIEDSADICKIALLEREKEEDEDVISYVQRSLIFVNKTSGELERRRGIWGVDTFTNIYTEERDWHNHADIRRLIMKVLGDANAHALREHGGVYFVPKESIEVIAKLRTLINNLSETCHLYIIPIPETGLTKKEIKKTFGDDIKADLVRFNIELNKIGAKKWKESTLFAKLKDFKKLSSKVKSYETLLNYRARDAKTAIKALKNKVKGMLETRENEDEGDGEPLSEDE